MTHMDRRSRPRVVANFAMTLDGKISTRTETPSLFTSPRDKERLLEIRALGDALLVGRTTVGADAMSMGLPHEGLREERVQRGQAPYPLRVVVSAQGNFDPGWKIFHSPGGRVVLFSSQAMPEARRAIFLENPEVDLHLPEEFSLAEALRGLRREYKIRTVVCEGGATLFRSLLALGAVDELFLTVAPRLFGGVQAPTLTGWAQEYLAPELRLRLREAQMESGEVYLHYER